MPRIQEVELNLPKDNQIPKTFPCPGCSSTLQAPDFICSVCNKIIVWVEN